MNKDYTNLSIKRSLDAALREIAIANQRTPQGQIDFWVKKEQRTRTSVLPAKSNKID